MLLKKYRVTHEKGVEDFKTQSEAVKKYPDIVPEFIQEDQTAQITMEETARTISEAKSALKSIPIDVSEVLEQVLDILEMDGLNIKARLPQEVQDKLNDRKNLRTIVGENK